MFPALLVLLLLCRQDSVTSVRLVELRVPTHEREGGSALLGCQYDMEDDVLYSVKWYKDSNEFFRYAPKNYPPIKHFDRRGVYVDESRSSATEVTLVNLTRDSAGMYSCEVSGEAPNFTTVTSQKYITMHLLPDRGPQTTGLQERYFIDDEVLANCTSSASRPEAHLKWLINGRPAPRHFLIGPWYRVSVQRADAVETTLQLRFRVVPSDFNDGAMRIKCQATIAPLYQRETSSVHYVALPFMETPSPVAADDVDNALQLKISLSTILMPVLLLIFII
ncbi:cell adhesion molecule 3 [Manduca sexta]|uniref:Ig-like domain-containing protein n=1 Tax=Manduca sexta TaxID=7130 RepID=A0A921ZF68_MANSE|nr:cell adhesion molecule 3 [Manduca sexta]KAG6456659.1 hypothetical protein O3G_MSEX009845 [Manduca sexta]